MKVTIERRPPSFGEAFLPFVPRGLRLKCPEYAYGGGTHYWYGSMVVRGTGFLGSWGEHEVARFHDHRVDVSDPSWWSAIEDAIDSYEKATGREVEVLVRDYQ